MSYRKIKSLKIYIYVLIILECIRTTKYYNFYITGFHVFNKDFYSL